MFLDPQMSEDAQSPICMLVDDDLLVSADEAVSMGSNNSSQMQNLLAIFVVACAGSMDVQSS